MTDDKEAKKIPLNEIQILPPDIDPSALIQYSLQATRQGTGTVSELAKVVVNKTLETDRAIHSALIHHEHMKILITVHEYNKTIELIEYLQQAGKINTSLADLTINHLVDLLQISLPLLLKPRKMRKHQDITIYQRPDDELYNSSNAFI